MSKALSMQAEFKRLDKLIGGLLGTQKTKLQSQSAKARAKGLPYDAHRLNLFSNLCAELKKSVLPILKDKLKTKDSLQNLAFFESYFSNYIEGTEFEIAEAEKIIFDNKIIRGRAADSHDILSTFRLVSNSSEMNKIPKTKKNFIALLKTRHHHLMSFRSDIDPGNFKQVSNRAGNTVFVSPDLVEGTLHEAFSLYNSLDEGLARAIFMMFIVSEVHPFNDGNGRLARIMMNAELSHAGETRIIIPTVYREDYLLTLRGFSRQHDPAPYIKMLLRAQAFVASIDFKDYGAALLQLKKANAFLEPFDGKLNFK